MKRATLLISVIFLFVLSARLSAQKQVQPSTPSSMHSAYGEKLRIEGVPNSGKINEHLFRGAQPRDPGLLELKKLGISTIVNLRDEDSARISWEEKERNHWGFASFTSQSTSGLLRQTNRSHSFSPSFATIRRRRSSCIATSAKTAPASLSPATAWLLKNYRRIKL